MNVGENFGFKDTSKGILEEAIVTYGFNVWILGTRILT